MINQVSWHWKSRHTPRPYVHFCFSVNSHNIELHLQETDLSSYLVGQKQISSQDFSKKKKKELE